MANTIRRSMCFSSALFLPGFSFLISVPGSSGSPTERGGVLDELAQLLESCATQQMKIVVDVVKATIVSLKKYL